MKPLEQARLDLKLDMTELVNANFIATSQIRSLYRSAKLYMKHSDTIYFANKKQQYNKHKQDLDKQSQRHEIEIKDVIHPQKLSKIKALETVQEITLDKVSKIRTKNIQNAKESILISNYEALNTYYDSDHYIFMFAKIIASAYDKTKNTHPLFTGFISNMSRNDALLLNDLYKISLKSKLEVTKPVVYINKVDNKIRYLQNEDFVINTQTLAKLDTQQLNDNEISLAISSLIEAGLLKIEEPIQFALRNHSSTFEMPKETYPYFYESPLYKSYVKKYPSDLIKCMNINVVFTSIGLLFAETVCVNNLSNELAVVKENQS